MNKSSKRSVWYLSYISIDGEFWSGCLLITEIDCPEVTLHRWHDVKIQLLTTLTLLSHCAWCYSLAVWPSADAGSRDGDCPNGSADTGHSVQRERRGADSSTLRLQDVRWHPHEGRNQGVEAVLELFCCLCAQPGTVPKCFVFEQNTVDCGENIFSLHSALCNVYTVDSQRFSALVNQKSGRKMSPQQSSTLWTVRSVSLR